MTRIILIGFMGSGKTTLGRALAKSLGLTFIDLDNYIELRHCKSINQIFAERGEEGFRTIERNLLHEVCEFEDVIISAGGGTPCFFDNIDYMNAQGTTIYLQVPHERLLTRLKIAKSRRPLLKDKSDEEISSFINEKMQQREPFYLKADYNFTADRLEDKEQIAESVARFRKQFNLNK
ncbi:MAG: shikimate kinase [Bacteroidaceae bacterium]|nr:shikimate kinase [Bacteroidaceae bacterium]